MRYENFTFYILFEKHSKKGLETENSRKFKNYRLFIMLEWMQIKETSNKSKIGEN